MKGRLGLTLTGEAAQGKIFMNAVNIWNCHTALTEKKENEVEKSTEASMLPCCLLLTLAAVF